MTKQPTEQELNQAYTSICTQVGDLFMKAENFEAEAKKLRDQIEVLKGQKRALETQFQALQAAKAMTPAETVEDGTAK